MAASGDGDRKRLRGFLGYHPSQKLDVRADLGVMAAGFAIAVLVVPGVRAGGWAAFLSSTSFFLVLSFAASLILLAAYVLSFLPAYRKYGEDIPKRYWLDQNGPCWWGAWVAFRVLAVLLNMLALVAVEHVVNGFDVAG